jgi:hypothetical protein
MVWESLGALANPKRPVMCLLLRSGFSGHHHKGWIGGVLQRWLSFCGESSPISTEELWNSVRVTIGFFVTSLTKALLLSCSALGRVLVDPNFFHLRMMEATVFFGKMLQNDGGHCVLWDNAAE